MWRKAVLSGAAAHMIALSRNANSLNSLINALSNQTMGKWHFIL